MSVTYVKFCPHCQTTNNVDSTACVKCGHQFRTQFQPPVSEKTIAMTSDVLPRLPGVPEANSSLSQRRPRPGRRLLLAALCVALALVALRFGSLVARSGSPAGGPMTTPAPPATGTTFQPYVVVFRSDAQGYPVPLATQSPDDLSLYKPDGADPVSVGLYHAGRIVLVYPGTSAQVLEEGTDWRHVTLESGAHQGVSGFVRAASVQKPADAPRLPGDLLTPPPTAKP